MCELVKQQFHSSFLTKGETYAYSVCDCTFSYFKYTAFLLLLCMNISHTHTHTHTQTHTLKSTYVCMEAHVLHSSMSTQAKVI